MKNMAHKNNTAALS